MNVLVVAAHPDDEVLGCAGTIAWHVDHGDVVDIAIIAEGATSRDATRDTAARAGELDELTASAARAAAALGAQPPRFGGLADNRLDGIDLLDVVKVVEGIVAELRPSVIYTHHAGDLNVDHGVVHRAVVTATRPQPGENVKAVYAFETVSSTEWSFGAAGMPFVPNRFVDIEDQLERKLEALRCYESELRPSPHARSLEAIEHLARWRGATCGMAAAEAFMVVRELVT